MAGLFRVLSMLSSSFPRCHIHQPTEQGFLSFPSYYVEDEAMTTVARMILPYVKGYTVEVEQVGAEQPQSVEFSHMIPM